MQLVKILFQREIGLHRIRKNYLILSSYKIYDLIASVYLNLKPMHNLTQFA